MLAHAIQEQRIVLTINCRDFLERHKSQNAHHGIVGIYKDRDPRKNMAFGAIASALDNLTAMQTGFDDPAYFTHVFRAATGLTSRDFRRGK